MKFATQHCLKRVGDEEDKSNIHRDRNVTWITDGKGHSSSITRHPTVSKAKHWMQYPHR